MIEAYLRVFFNYKQKNRFYLLYIAEFAYNNAKNMSIGYISFEFNRDYHFRVFYKENIDPRFKSKSSDKLSSKLRQLINIGRKNLHHS